MIIFNFKGQPTNTIADSARETVGRLLAKFPAMDEAHARRIVAEQFDIDESQIETLI
ncbi:MAG: hypothetical protein M3430_01670 [Acidobacteriota bacterium]|nr:hypothetical protein [Acidobacteriota bacterium]